jgi:hypothetical protein
MSLTNYGKALHRRATQLLGGHRLVFIHAPKCGGTSAGGALRRAYITSQATVKPHETAQAFNAAWPKGQRAGSVDDLREMMLLYLLYCDTRCIAAHVPFSDVAFETFGQRYRFATLLREPVERFISHYYWDRRSESPWPITEPIEEFLVGERAKRMGSTYVRYFCGEPWSKEFTAKHIDAAIANIRRLHAVGFLDDMRKFEADLRRLTGRRLKIGRENVGNRKPKDAMVTGRLRERLLEVCSADRAVWDAVQDLRSI